MSTVREVLLQHNSAKFSEQRQHLLIHQVTQIVKHNMKMLLETGKELTWTKLSL